MRAYCPQKIFHPRHSYFNPVYQVYEKYQAGYFAKREFLSVPNILKFPSFAQSPEWYEPQPNKLSLHFHAVITHLDFVKVFPSLTGNPHLNFMNFFLALFNIAIYLWKRGISFLLAHQRKHKIIQFHFKQTHTYLLKNGKRKYKNKRTT